MSNSSFGNEISNLVLKVFTSLPTKYKPVQRTPGVREWVPLAGIVLEKDNIRKCVALGTGMKCLPQSKLHLAKGAILHDTHAEILALRALNVFLLRECLQCQISGSSEWIRQRDLDERNETEPQSFAIIEDVKIYMYGSEAPCGDASMEIMMSGLDDSTPWIVPDGKTGMEMVGRGYFSELGIVRRKPARPDAPVCLSKSCTDKFTMGQFTSILGSLASAIISPKNAYIHAIVIPETQFVETSVNRAFGCSGRLVTVLQNYTPSEPFRFQPLQVHVTTQEFAYSRRGHDSTNMEFVACNKSVTWTPYFEEVLVNGILQGRKEGDLKGASNVSRRNIWKLSRDVAAQMGDEALQELLTSGEYAQVKQKLNDITKRAILKERVTGLLKGWVSNKGDDDFSI